MTALVTFYEGEPADLRGKVELEQLPWSDRDSYRSNTGQVRAKTIYALAPQAYEGAFRQAQKLLVPFSEYDDWSLRDRYNEVLRVMGELGACEIECRTFRVKERRTRLGFKAHRTGTSFEMQRVEGSGYDFHHVGVGSAPRDPAPLKWPEEPGLEAARLNVMNNGAREVELKIHKSSSLRADSELGVRLKKLGFSLGAGHSKGATVVLHVTAKFNPPPAERKWYKQ